MAYVLMLIFFISSCSYILTQPKKKFNYKKSINNKIKNRSKKIH